MRILVADDDPVYRDLLRQLLGGWGFDVTAAADGIAALRSLEKPDAPQLAILDWMMPSMDGFEVARTVRETSPASKTYIMLITNSRKKEEIMKVLVCGADDYLLKPFDPIDLKIHLRSATRIINLQQELDELRNRQRRGVF